MIDKLVFEGPLNNLSMGNVSINLLLSLYKKGIKVLYLPIGQPDIGNYKLTDDFKSWLQSAGNNFLKLYKRDWVTLKNWHLNQSWHFPTDKRYLLTYHEVDDCTEEENCIIRNINKVFFCGNYSEEIFKDYGHRNIDSFNLGFDSNSFYKTNRTYFNDRIQFLLSAKAEFRKNTFRLLSLWAKKFGKRQGESWKLGEQKCFLNCCITNPFYDLKIQEQQIAQALNNERYINIQFFQFLPRESFNDLLNATDIDLTGLSGGESWNLIPFNITCLGKWSIVSNCTGHKAWATNLNSILVNPSSKVVAEDGLFFHRNSVFSRGNFYSFTDEEIIEGMEKSIKFAKKPNLEGERLVEKFTYDKSIDYILNKIEEDLKFS